MGIFDWIDCVLAAFCTAGASQHYIHMLQLESYQLPGYNGYLKRDRERVLRETVIPGLLISVIAFVAGILGDIQTRFLLPLRIAILSVLVIYSVIRVLIDIRRPMKKALVYTKRVIRLEAVLVPLSLLVALFFRLIKLPPYIGFAGCAYVVQLAALIAQPIEKRVNMGFYRAAEQKLRERDDMIKIGITGSYGKTSTKFALKEILSVKYRVLATPASFNTPMGLSRVINEQLLPEHQVFLAEMGARHEGDIRELCELVHPTIGVITSIGPQHLETFGSIEKIAGTKYELMEELPGNGLAFFASGSVMLDRLYARCEKEKYRVVSDDVHKGYMMIKDVETNRNGSLFTLRCEDGEEVRCRTSLLGTHNIENIALCACVARKLGLTMDEIARGISRIMPVEHRLQLIRTGASTVIDDAFNSNPKGSEEALKVLADFPGRRVIVTPGMVEQGEKEDEINYAFGSQMPGRVDIAILVGPKHTAPIRKALLAGGFDEGAIYMVKNLTEATQVLGSIHTDADVVLFENDLPDNYDE